MDETRKHFGFTLWPGRFRRHGSGFAAAPASTAEAYEEHEDNKRDGIDNQVDLQDQPLHLGGRWADLNAFRVSMN